MKKLTAVEWLVDELKKNHGIDLRLYDEFEHAKEMEKQRIIKTYDIAVHDTLNFDIDRKSSWHFAEKHFNETFKSE